MKSILFTVLALTFAVTAQAAPKAKRATGTYYFSCPVKEGRTEVSVKFAIKGLNPNQSKGDLVQYPGSDEDAGMISVTPIQKSNGDFTRMSNLNGQGGDLRMQDNGDIHFYGDGDGIQNSYLHLWWDASDLEEVTSMEGYVRDYTRGDEANMFKQFITCEVSTEVL